MLHRSPRRVAGLAVAAVALSVCTLTSAGAAPVITDGTTITASTSVASGPGYQLTAERGLHAALEPRNDTRPTLAPNGTVTFTLPPNVVASQVTASLLSTEVMAVGQQTEIPGANIDTSTPHTVKVTLDGSLPTATAAFLQLSDLSTNTTWAPLQVSAVTGISLDIAAAGAASATRTLGLSVYLDTSGVTITPGQPFSLSLSATDPAVLALGGLTFQGGRVEFGPFDPAGASLQRTTGQLSPAFSNGGRTVTVTVPADYPTFNYPAGVEPSKLVLSPVAGDPSINDVTFFLFDVALVNPALPAYDPSNIWPRYVTRVYNDLFDRNPDPTGLAAWSAALTSGANLTAVSNAITGSPEYRGQLIQGVYQEYLGRGADPTGLAGWLGAMAAGTQVQGIESGFIASQEYYNQASAKAGVQVSNQAAADAAWVSALYTDVLDRPAGASEVAAWTNALRSMSRGQVSNGFLYSTEHLNAVVDGYYVHLLGRGPDAQGQAGWVYLIQSGSRVEQIIAAIVTSPEYINLKNNG